jgi:type IV pilus assembly protein PilN
MIRINLLPTKKKRKQLGIKQELILTGLLLVLVSILLGLLWSWQNHQVERLTLDKNQKQRELEQLKKVVAEVEQFKKDKQQYELKIKIIKELENQQSGPVHVLDELSLNLPEKLWLQSLSVKGNLLTLSGSAFANISIVDFINNLKNSPYFQNVQLLESKANSKENYRVYVYKLSANVTLPAKGQ